MKKRHPSSFSIPSAYTLIGGGMTLLAVLLSAHDSLAQPPAAGTPKEAKAEEKQETKAEAKKVEVNLDDASIVKVPANDKYLMPIAFNTPDNKEGWIINIPGNRPIATPAYAEGMIFVGGGYGSHEFYAFDANSGQLKWQYKTDDDGPTAAVIDSGCAAFNTESCTVYVLNIKDGSLKWKEWLGDPLMSQPAIADGRLFIAYPTNGKKNSWHAPVSANMSQINPGKPAGTKDQHPLSHSLLCADLHTGKHLWEVPIPADVITAPVVEGGEVFLSCHDGTSFCITAETGKVAWQRKNNATSAPLIAEGKVITAERRDKGSVAYQGLSIIAKGTGATASSTIAGTSSADLPQAWGGDEFVDNGTWYQSGAVENSPQSADSSKHAIAKAAPPPAVITGIVPAPFLQSTSKGLVGMSKEQTTALDSSVGFAGGAPAAANLSGSQSNLGIDTVAGGWAYQGSRASHIYGDEGSFATAGDQFYQFNNKSGAVSWRATTRGGGIEAGAQVFAPPSLGKKSMYLVTGQGHVLSVDKDSGNVNYMYAFKQPITFQAALARGNIYVGTGYGKLICLKTNDPDADDWTAWGGNARHNK